MYNIHPTSYSVFGNKVLTEQEKEYINAHWPNEKSYGSPMPLFGWSASTGNEGEHNAMRSDGSRHCGPLSILEKWMLRANTRVVEMLNNCKMLRMRGCNLFKWPTSQFVEQKSQVVFYNVKTTPGENYFHVQRRGNSTNKNTFDVHSVNLSTLECSECATRHQLQCACCHVLAVVNYLGIKNENHPFLKATEYCIENFFHDAYVNEDVQEGFKDKTLRIPVRSDLKLFHEILPRPTYENGAPRKKTQGKGFMTGQHPLIESKVMVNSLVVKQKWILQ